MILVLACATDFTHSRNVDFTVFWDAGRIANAGSPLFAWAKQTFPYPPPFLIFVQPFALLPHAAALTAWVVITLGLVLWTARGIRGLTPPLILAFPPTIVNGMIGQAGFLTAAMFLGGTRLLGSRPLLAGALFGALIVKPQMGVLLPFAFVAGRMWRAFFGATCSVVLLTATSAFAYGPAAFSSWFDVIHSPVSILLNGSAGWEKMASVFTLLRMQGASSSVAWTAHIAVVLVALAATVRTWSRNTDPETRCAVLACATTLASPYICVYDLVMLVLPIAWCQRESGQTALLTGLVAALGASVLLNWVPNAYPNPAPIVGVTLLMLTWRLSERAIGNNHRPRAALQAALGAA